ncbi:hypothetical protein BGZ60DRAFT_466310 [Tricladium varicosporioides]|nr:hypothetical protein BGZ60DRAFT_466310 [Hymenoscyphus varicosporioides]
MKFLVILFVSFTSLSTAQEISPIPTTCTIQNNAAYPTSSKLPDPFLLANGKRLSTKDEWVCKRAEIRDQIQRYELGRKPAKPTVSATMTGNKLNISCSDASKYISFTATIKLPTGAGPFPALIAFEGGSIPVPTDVATITYSNHDIAADDPRGKGKFYDLYGTSHPAGALMAWAWGVSRVIDAIELLGPALTKIDTKRLAITGCSRNGKGALIASAFDDRISLTIPQEGGSGGPGCWRIVASIKANGTKTEDATQIVKGDSWFSTNFSSYAANVDVMPYDHHMLMALISPRALLVIENSGIDYLGPVSTYGCSVAARMVFESLGVGSSMGVSQASHGSSHCSMPASQNPEVAAFFGRFLGGKDVQTDVVKTDGKFSWVREQWVEWTLPLLV